MPAPFSRSSSIGPVEKQSSQAVSIPSIRSLQKILTPREVDVAQRIVAGASAKEIARDLNISPRTIEAHRAHIMQKLSARNSADLVRIVVSITSHTRFKHNAPD